MAFVQANHRQRRPADALTALHGRIWQASEDELHPWWRCATHRPHEAYSSRRGT